MGLNRLIPGALALLLLLSACSQTDSQQEALLDPNDPVYLTVWTYYNGTQLTAFQDMVEQFNQTRGKELGIMVEGFSHGAVLDLEDNVRAAAQGDVGADDLPNMFAAYGDSAFAIDQMGLVADLAPYLTQEEQAGFVDSYLEEGRFSGDSTIKIFPIAKSTEILLLNQTDWDTFAKATGASTEELATMEGLVATAQAYYEWTDSLTPAPNDGKAFFGRDALANYILVGGMELGTEILGSQDGVLQLDFNKETIRKLWDHYYVPYVKGYFAAFGRFRSDDVKTGALLACVGSSSGVTFFPDQVILSDTEQYPIQVVAYPCPQFADSQAYAVQQGAGMVVTTGEPAEVYACVQFLKWFTEDARNINFSVDSGYLPVQKEANDMAVIRQHKENLTPLMEKVLTVAVDSVHRNTLYTPKPFVGGSTARNSLADALEARAEQDRALVVARLAQGQTLAQATADFTGDDAFDEWYTETLAMLEALSQ